MGNSFFFLYKNVLIPLTLFSNFLLCMQCNSVSFDAPWCLRKATAFEFSVYRKPTHERRIKGSVVFSLLFRAYRICSPNYLKDEINKVFEAFLKLAYPKHFMDSIHREVKKTFYGTPCETPSAEYVPTIAIPYTNFSKNLIRPILSHNRCRTVHKYGSSQEEIS